MTTVHETRGVRVAMRWLALLVMRLSGWKVAGDPPPFDRYVAIAAPHTSNWDFLYTVCLAFIFRINPAMMMKDAWFFWPLGPFFRWLGAVPVDRSRASGMVAQSIRAFGRHNKLVLVVPPSGTRRRVTRWKTGFYHIARGAGVPIALGFLDYRRRTGGFGPVLHPTGDIERDMTAIRGFYAGVTGRHPLQESRSLLAPGLEPRP